jgi:formylglycine-generating enzyme required for sulfatase activity
MNTRNLGDYALIKQIGQGSLGTVFLAEHRFLKRAYALKVLPEELGSDRTFVQRFEKEVASLAMLEHPNIVKMHNVSFSDGQYFLVTDCIVDALGETTNLSQYLSLNEKLPEEEVVKIAHQAASALDYAHQKQIGEEPFVHRGIKLNNILIGKGKEGINIFLSDFGLTRVVGTGAVLSRTYKAVSESLGVAAGLFNPKPGVEKYVPVQGETNKLSKLCLSFLQNYSFLAPEQKVLDESRPVDAKADIYAFGVLMYYLIMREYPEGFFDLPSVRVKDFKLNWDLLIYRCLQRDPDKRPESLRQALEELLSSTSPVRAIAAQIQKWNAPEQKKNQERSALEKLIPKEHLAFSGSAVSLKGGAPKPILRPQEIKRPEFDADPGAIFQIETTVARYQPTQAEDINIEPMLIEMAVIRGGRFFRGSNNGGRDEMPHHEVSLPGFAIDIHPVTNEQFARFLEAMGGEKDANNNDIIRLRDSRIKRSGGRLSIESGYAKHPVVGVAWYGAVAYAKWVGKRLPTEAEWEIAGCGGLEDCVYPTGSNIERSQANFFSSDTTSVMSYPANGYGLYDMAGNVYEWCQDWYDYHYYDSSVQEPENPKGPLQGVYRVLRGGCWKSLKEDMRCAHRHRNNPGTMNGTYGFRCAADIS